MADEEGEAATEEEVVKVSLTPELIESGISMLCKSEDGTSYAYTKLTLPVRRSTERPRFSVRQSAA